MGSRFKGWSADELHDDYRAGKGEAVRLLLRGSSKRGGVRARYVASPRQDTNVVGVGIGRRYAEGKGSSEHAVRVYVRRKLPKSQVGKHKIPDHFDGIRLSNPPGGPAIPRMRRPPAVASDRARSTAACVSPMTMYAP